MYYLGHFAVLGLFGVPMRNVQWVPALGHDRAMRYRILTVGRGVTPPQGDGVVIYRKLSNPRVPKIMLEGGLCRESERAIAVRCQAPRAFLALDVFKNVITISAQIKMWTPMPI
jgi:hypothetical protein